MSMVQNHKVHLLDIFIADCRFNRPSSISTSRVVGPHLYSSVNSLTVEKRRGRFLREIGKF